MEDHRHLIIDDTLVVSQANSVGYIFSVILV
ncbi:MAG: hypothetical protein ACI94Y_000645 [Maribacter sp.]|jgi:hypothetical protein